MAETEHELDCPFCGEPISVLVDCSPSNRGESDDFVAEWIEDCSVCCRPISFRANCQNGDCAGLEIDRSV